MIWQGAPFGRLVLFLALLAPAVATAGPPFRTDDPEPVEQGHWEVYEFSTATRARGDTAGTLSGIDANYGAAPELQLHAGLPATFDDPSSGATAIGYGDTELGAKYRFLTEDESGWRPQAAIYPAIDFPTGNAARNLGTGRTHAGLPVWVQKGFGKWTTFAGIEYWINPGAGNRDYWYFGWSVQRQVTGNLAVGAEIFNQTSSATGVKDQTGFDLGIIYDLSEHYHLLVSAGQGVQNRSSTNQFSYYAALQFTF